MKTIMTAIVVAVAFVGVIMPISAIDEVAFFQKPVCNGNFYRMTLGSGQCRQLPGWLSQAGWNLSIDPEGHCVKLYENDNCAEVVSYAYSRTSSRKDVVRRCRSTKQLGFSTIRSFKRVPCP